MSDVPDVTSNGTSLGAICKARRTEKGLRLEDLAYKTRLATKTITRVETGFDVRLSTIAKIAEGLGTTTWELIREAEQAASGEAKAS